MRRARLFLILVLALCGAISVAVQADSHRSGITQLVSTPGAQSRRQRRSGGPSPLQNKDYLVWDADPTATSGSIIDLTLLNNRYSGDYTADIVDYLDTLSAYSSIWICLGVMPNNYVLEDTFGTQKDSLTVDSLVSYLVNHAGKIYMEGGDTWAWDTPTALHPFFSIVGELDGSSISGVLGTAGSFGEGMDMDYGGENSVLDDIAPSGSAVLAFVDRGNLSQGIGVAYDHGIGMYKTVGFSFEFGGLIDGFEPSTKLTLGDSIMHFLGIFPPPPPNWDVGVLSIDNPDTPYVEPWLGLNPTATVKNWGLNAATFSVWCEVDSEGTIVHQSSQVIGPLGPDLTQSVSFALWSPAGPGNYYALTFYTQLPGDQNPANDTLGTTVTTSRLFGTPVDSAKLSGLPANTLAGIAYCEMDSMFYFVSSLDEYVYRLDPNTWAYEQAFATVNPGSENPWGISWDGDYFWVEHHDPLFTYFYDRQYTYGGNATGHFCDVGSLVGGRAAGMDFDRRYMRQAKWNGDNGIYRVDTYSSILIDFITGPWSGSAQMACSYIPYTHQLLTGGNVSDYFYKIDAQDGSQLRAVPLPNMADVDIRDLGVRGTDTLYAYVTTTDPDNTIYKVAIEFRLLKHDFAAISIDVPGDTVAGQTPILTTVANWGRTDESDVWIYCSATQQDSLIPEHEDSARVSITAGEELQVAFGDTWVIAQVGVDYEILVQTRLAGDENFCDDEVIKWVHSVPVVHDGGVDSIVSPPDTVYPDSAYLPGAWVRNCGNVPEAFDVVCVIDGYQDTVSIAGLGPGSALPCTFSAWIVPTPDSMTYLMTVATLVEGDSNASNDTLTKSIFACRVGIEEELNFQFPISDCQLDQNSPNPFSHSTTIRYCLPDAGRKRSPRTQAEGTEDARHITLSVHDLGGRLVKTLLRGRRGPGYYWTVWDGKNELGVPVASGVYFYRLSASEGEDAAHFTITRKLVVLR